MVIQQLQMVKALLENNPPNVEEALRELDIAMTVAIQEYRKRNQQPPMDLSNWTPVRDNDELLKEFGW